VGLPDHFIKALRPHPFGEGAILFRGNFVKEIHDICSSSSR
jgi:hypothetical protein